jgi:sterol desaturase/sphingolipid hydroxylase (fatty acid hydroxylase superfamily)
MEAVRQLLSEGVAHVVGTFNPNSAYGAPALCGALLVALGWFVWRRRSRGRAFSLKVFRRAMFPRRILMHPSSWVDVRLWTLNTIVFASGYGWFVVGSFFWRDRVLAALTRGFGAYGGLHAPSAVAMFFGTLAELLAFEFGYWASHYVFHRIPTLWEFHKVHHSAEVMTTLTEMRQHPVEIIVFMNVQALCTGMVFGLMTYLFGHVGHWALLDGNIVLGLFILTWGHLRHSHIWMPVQGLMGKLFQSPAHHQVHHSTDPRHYDKNLGFALAVWDWTFGTLHIPSQEREVSRYGVGDEYEDYATATRSLTRPFAKAGQTLKPSPLAGDVRVP